MDASDGQLMAERSGGVAEAVRGVTGSYDAWADVSVICCGVDRAW